MNAKALLDELARQKMSITILAERSGIERSTVYRIINGESHCNIDTARKIAETLRLNPKQVSSIFFDDDRA